MSGIGSFVPLSRFAGKTLEGFGDVLEGEKTMESYDRSNRRNGPPRPSRFQKQRGGLWILPLLPFLLFTSCIQLEVSPFDSSQGGVLGWVGALFPDVPCYTFHAYSNGAKSFLTYNTCAPEWTLRSYTATNILQRVAKTGSGFVALDNSTTDLYSSTDSITWSSAAAFPGETASGARVAACGDTVVIAYVNGAGSAIETIRSTDGGSTFSVPVTVITATTIWDLVCVDNVFHLSGGNATVSYKRSTDGGASWITPASNPNTFGIPVRALGVGGSTVMGYYQSTFLTLTRSLDGGNSWSEPGSTLPGGYNNAITYAAGYFLVPYVNGGNCIFRRSNSNGSSWDDTRTISCPGVEQIHKIKGGGSTIVASGQDNATPLIFLSTDGSETWSKPTLPLGAVGNQSELIVY